MNMRKAIKNFTRQNWVQQTVAWLGAQFMTLVFKTNSWQYLNKERVEPYWQSSRPIIVCFWHNRLAMMTYAWLSETPFHMMISGHADGKIISLTVGHHGIKTIAGSTSKGSSEAIRKILRVLKQGESVGVTPDGPRGPRFSINQGLINLASKAGVDLVPMTYSTSRRIVWKSWDRLVFPLPFGKGVIVYGEPIQMNSNQSEADLIAAGKLLRERLIDICNQADQHCGNEIIPEPDMVKATT